MLESEAYIRKNFTISNGKVVDRWAGLPLRYKPRPGIEFPCISILDNEFTEREIKVVLNGANL